MIEIVVTIMTSFFKKQIINIEADVQTTSITRDHAQGYVAANLRKNIVEPKPKVLISSNVYSLANL